MPKQPARSKTTKAPAETPESFFEAPGSMDDFFRRLNATSQAPTPPVQAPPAPVVPLPVEAGPNLPAYSVGSPLPVVSKSGGEAPAMSGQLPAYWSGGKNMAAIMDAAAEKNREDWGSVLMKIAKPAVDMVGSLKETISESMKPASVSVAAQKLTPEEYEAKKKKYPGLYK